MKIYEPEYFKESKRFTIQDIETAIESGDILEGIVKRCNKNMTLTLDLGNKIIGEISAEDLEYIESDNKQAASMTKVGKTVKFIPISIRNNRNTVIVKCSRALAQERCYNNYISKLVPGDIIEAMALKYETYGIFCDIGCGITALLPTGKIRVPYIVDPCRENKCIKKLYAVINKIHTDGKIELTHRELLGTWDDEIEHIHKGEIRLGKVLSKKDYGYFIMISQNLQGLAEQFSESLTAGDTVSVKVLYINNDKCKVKLQIMNKVDNQPIFKEYNYRKTSGHIDDWEYCKNAKEVSTFY